MERRTIASGSPFEPEIGFSRAVVDGHHVAVAGTASVMPDGAAPPADAYGRRGGASRSSLPRSRRPAPSRDT